VYTEKKERNIYIYIYIYIYVCFCVGCILLDKITSMYCCCFHRDAVYFRVFKIFRVYFSDIERASL